MIKVELTGSWGGDLSVVNAARVSFGKHKDTLDDSDVKLIKYLAKHRHDTPFRHNFVQLRCSAPVFLARQLMKHQVGLTWNEISRRYVDTSPEFYDPGDQWRGRPEGGLKQGSAGIVEGWDYAYTRHLMDSRDLYETMVQDNVAPEMARMVLPQSMMTEWIWSGNLLAFHHVWDLRSPSGAQQEAQDFANELELAIKPEFPVAWQALTNRVLYGTL